MTPSPHETPKHPDAILASLRPAPQKRFVFAKAQYSPDPATIERTIIFSEVGPYLCKSSDAWLSPDDYVELLSQLRNTCHVSTGSCDAMYGTTARHVWSADEGQLRLWRRRLLIATFSAQNISIRNTLVGWSDHETRSFTSCHGFVSATWRKRGVALERRLRPGITVAETSEPMALIDPTYDGIDLMCDASWVGELARAISNVTSLHLKLDNGL